MFYRAFLLNIIKTLAIVFAAVFLFACSSEEGKDKKESNSKSLFNYNKFDLFYDNDYGRLKRVVVNNKYGYIDKEGKIVIKPQFDWAEDFSHKWARVIINNKYGLIDNKGRFVVYPQFDYMEYSGGSSYYRVLIGNKWWVEIYIDEYDYYYHISQFLRVN